MMINGDNDGNNDTLSFLIEFLVDELALDIKTFLCLQDVSFYW